MVPPFDADDLVQITSSKVVIMNYNYMMHIYFSTF